MVVKVKVKARSRLTDTGLNIEVGGLYRFSSEGRWVDWFIPCGATGYRGFKYMKRYRPHLRMPSANWFSVIGEIQGSTEQIDIGGLITSGATYTAKHSGRLFCYANDVADPNMYWNNWGSIHLSVERLEGNTTPDRTTRAEDKQTPEEVAEDIF